MKRLKAYFSALDAKNVTYETIYAGAYGYDNNGKIFYVTDLKNVRSDRVGNDPVYWKDDVSYEIRRTHKFTLSKPSVSIKIPLYMLNIADAKDKCVICDCILREFNKYIDELNEEIGNRARPDIENGKYYTYIPTGEVLTRNMCFITPEPEYDYAVNIMITIQFPEKKHKKAMNMMCVSLPRAVEKFINDFDIAKINKAVELHEKQRAIREWLRHSDYCGFVANGAILPRKGNSSLPAENAVPFKSPEQNEIEICGIKGMGIKKGVTVVTGGGYSGKSTLLDAVSAGIYDHIQGDGREFVITDDTAIKISAEDGRSVKNVNLSPFIKWLPNGGDASHFVTEHASGSTSQAANIIEAVNFGAKLFLIDEDKSATNFMIRDDMMKELIKREPITPFTDRVRQLYNEAGISTILVVGGSGEYLSVADSVIMMDEFYAFSVTKQAKEIYKKVKNVDEITNDFDEDSGQQWLCERKLKTAKFSSYPKESEDAYSGTERLEISDMGFILIGDEKIDVRNLHNFISFAQITAVGYMLRHLEISTKEAVSDMKQIIDNLYDEIDEKGIDFVHSTFFNCERWLDMPRKCELLAVINRMRFIEFTAEN